MSKTKNCSECGMEIPQKAKICPYCQSKQKQSEFLTTLLAIIVMIVFAGGGMKMCSNDTDKQNKEVSSTEATIDDTSSKTTQDVFVEEKEVEADEIESTEMNEEEKELKAEVVAKHQPAIINDPDGFTNVRATPDSQSEIVAKIVDGERFFFDEIPGSNWVKIYRTADASAQCIGYMYKSRVMPKSAE